jgi:putative transposase
VKVIGGVVVLVAVIRWHNTARLHGYLGDIPPAEFEATFYATQRNDQPLVEIQ